MTIGGKHYAVQIINKDTQSDPAKAAQVANELIHRYGIDLMLSTSTPEVVNPVADACEAAGVPCVGTVDPWESWYFGRGAKPGGRTRSGRRSTSASAPQQFADAYLATVAAGEDEQEGRRHVAERRRRQRLPREPRPAAEEGGLQGLRPGRATRTGTTDYTAQISKFKQRKLRDLQLLPDPARLHDLLEAGGAAGLHADGADLPDREDRASSRRRSTRVGHRSATTSRAAPTGIRPSRTSRD